MVKITGIRQAVQDIQSCPRGFHVEVWAERSEDGSVHVWTSEWLSQSSWTTNHPDSEVCLDDAIGHVRFLAEVYDKRMSLTATIKEAVQICFGGDRTISELPDEVIDAMNEDTERWHAELLAEDE